MDFDTASKWIGFVSLVISVITAIWTLVSKSTKPYEDKLQALEVSKVDHDGRIQSIEDELKHLPDKQMVHEIQLALVKLEGHFSRLEATLNASERKLDRIERSIDARPS